MLGAPSVKEQEGPPVDQQGSTSVEKQGEEFVDEQGGASVNEQKLAPVAPGGLSVDEYRYPGEALVGLHRAHS